MALSFQLRHVNINHGKVRTRKILVNQGVLNIQVVVKAIELVISSTEMAAGVEKRVRRRAEEQLVVLDIRALLICSLSVTPLMGAGPIGISSSHWISTFGAAEAWGRRGCGNLVQGPPFLQVTHITEHGALRLRHSLQFVLVDFHFPW